MGGLIALGLFLLCGAATAWNPLRKAAPAVRIWLGLSCGMAMAMWFPSLFAFAVGFTRAAQYCALALALLCAVLSFMLCKGKRPLPVGGGEAPPLKTVMALALPLAAVSLYLLHTHTLREVDGALHVGQSTYGDLCLHLGIATGLQNASYPPEYTILPGVTLGYPFLTDALSATMLLFGSTLRQAFIAPAFVQMALVYWGFALLAWELTHDKRAVAVAFLLLFLNGGLGFMYSLDMWPSQPDKISNLLFGYYQAPANMPEYNLRWSNLLCDLFVPQRTLLAGWTMVVPALYLLCAALRKKDRRLFIVLGVWAGLMPMVHTHSFLALGLISAGCMIRSLLRSRARWETVKPFLLYGIVAVLLALPQLLLWTFPQTVRGGSLRLWFNWVNGTGAGLKDGYLWFWIKNVGPVYLLMIPAALSGDRRARALSAGALAVYCVAETVLFQPNVYDNNKLFYVAFLLMTPIVAKYLLDIFDRLRGVRGRAMLAAAFMTVSLLSGALSVVRECVSDYELFSANDTAAAAWLRDNTARDDVVLTAYEHNNPVSSLAGRKIVCGTDSYLFYHGVDYSAQRDAARLMFEAPEKNEALFSRYGVKYVYVGDNERATFLIDEKYFVAHCAVAYQNAAVTVYALDGAS